MTNAPTPAGMAEYRKTATIMASQWFKMGDHPAVFDVSRPGEDPMPWCHTLEGGHAVSVGDWIATGVQGEHWPIKPDVFAATYALAAQPSAGAEPVAWIAVWNDGTRYGEPHSWPPLEGTSTYHGLMGRTIQPLHAHPATVQPDSGGVVEAVDRVMAVLNHWFDGALRVDRNSEMVAQLAALSPVAAEGGEKDKLRIAVEALVNEFAWSAVTADCEEARVELQRRIDAVRAALRTEPTGETGGAL